MSELRTNRIVPKNGLVSGANSAGGIIQIQQGTLTAPASTSTSGSFTDTGLTCAITPTRSDSKVFCMVSLGSISQPAGTSVGFRLVRGSTVIGAQFFGAYYAGTGGSDLNNYGNVSIHCLDSPATTSSTTYKIQINSDSTSSTAGVTAGGNAQSTITLMEVSA